MLKKNYVEFYSPGTFVAETSNKEIDTWNIDEAVEMARSIKERHGSVPYGFRFVTRGREDNELDSKQIASSPMYFLGGTIETLQQIKARNNKADRILISNMEGNGWDRVITNTNSWKVTQPLIKDDVVLDFTP